MTTERAKRTKKKEKGHAQGHLKVVTGHLRVVRGHLKVVAGLGQGHVTVGDQGQNLLKRRIRRAKRIRGSDLETDPGIDPGTERMRRQLVGTRKRRNQIGTTRKRRGK
jgi:hypothetical protein